MRKTLLAAYKEDSDHNIQPLFKKLSIILILII